MNAGDCGPELTGPLLDEPTLQRVGHRLETTVCAKLAIDAMEVVTQRLSRNAQLACDRRRVVAFGEEFEDAALVIGQRLDRCVLGRVIRKQLERKKNESAYDALRRAVRE